MEAPFSKLESEIGELSRRGAAAPRLQQENDRELNVGSLVQNVSGRSAQEVEKLIAELQVLRDKLQNEAARATRDGGIRSFATRCQEIDRDYFGQP